MPFVWIEYGRINVISKKVFLKYADCVADIEARIKENPDDFPYEDFCPAYEGDLETMCKENGSIIYTFYDDYDKEFQIHYVEIV